MGKIERIQVPPEDRERFERLVKDRNTPQKIVWRSRIVLLAGEGNGAVAVARRVGKSVLTVRRWRRRYAAKGVDGLLKDASRPPGRKPLTARKINQVVNLTCRGIVTQQDTTMPGGAFCSIRRPGTPSTCSPKKHACLVETSRLPLSQPCPRSHACR